MCVRACVRESLYACTFVRSKRRVEKVVHTETCVAAEGVVCPDFNAARSVPALLSIN